MSTELLIATSTFFLMSVLILVPYYLFIVRRESVDRATLRQRLTARAVTLTPTGASVVLRQVERLSTLGPLNSLLGGGNRIASSLRTLVEQSGLKVTPGQIVTGSACLALLVYVLVMLRWPYWFLGLPAGLVAGVIPYATLRFFRMKRLSKFEEHFPEAIDLIARTLRAGHSFMTGLRLAADELPEPVAAEFKLLHDQQNYGLHLTDALRGFAIRVPIIDARFFVTAVLTQREAGGNLAEVLDNLSTVIRERFRIKRQLRVLTARGRLTGWILAGLPPAMGAFFMIRMPEHFHILIEEPLGIQMILVALLLQVVGAVMIHKITGVEY